jgi:hypothetical protein
LIIRPHTIIFLKKSLFGLQREGGDSDIICGCRRKSSKSQAPVSWVQVEWIVPLLKMTWLKRTSENKLMKLLWQLKYLDRNVCT